MPASLQVALHNDSTTDQIWAYITGISLQEKQGQRCLLKPDGHSLYFPQEPPSIGTPLAEDCAIPLGAPGNTVTVTIPQIAGGRIWIARGKKLTFLLNPGGPALVEPSVLNPSDPNADVDFAFAEFTLNDAQLYANISYVDMAPALPIAISLREPDGRQQDVAGMAPDGIDKLAADLRKQEEKDGKPWGKLVVEKEGRVLRVLNATHGNAVGADFSGYFEPYVEQVWEKYSDGDGGGACCRIDTQAGPGVLEGKVTAAGKLCIGDEEFDKPNTADILGCNSGPFTTGENQTRNAIIPRLAAAFHRSALLHCEDHPSMPDTFFSQDPTNHYARLVHVHNVDRKGYAFAYDDVQPEGGEDQSGKVNAGDPVLFTVSAGGESAGKAGGSCGNEALTQEGSGSSGGYDRAPAPPPPADEGDDRGGDGSAPPQPPPPAEKAGGLRDKVKGFAGRFMK
jgi:hypothetical protein